LDAQNRHNNPSGDREWFKSSYSNALASCVEARFTSDSVGVRDSKEEDGAPVLAFSPSAWSSFLTDVT